MTARSVSETGPRGRLGRAQGHAQARAPDSEELFREHYPRLAGWCRRLLDDDATAHDIASEAFVRLLARTRSVDDPRGYLYTVALNLVRDHWRRTARERRGLRLLRPFAAAQVDAGATSRSEVRVLVERLPDRLQRVVLLHYFADLSVDRVADLLGRPPGTIKSDLHDARRVLRASLEATR